MTTSHQPCHHIIKPGDRYSGPAEVWCSVHNCNSGSCPSPLTGLIDSLLKSQLTSEQLVLAIFERQDQTYAELQRMVNTLDLFVQRVSIFLQPHLTTHTTKRSTSHDQQT